MKYYRLTAELLSPLQIQLNRQSNMSMTLDYLTGSTLRGALAAGYLRQGGDSRDDSFKILFKDHGICWPNLYPTDNSHAIPRIIPFTAKSCKRVSGFSSEQKHGVKDFLASILVERILNFPLPEEYCQKCNSELRPFSGYWNGNIRRPIQFEADILYQHHTGIDRTTGTVANEIFYTTQMISHMRRKNNEANDNSLPIHNVESQQLTGSISLNNEHYSRLVDLISNRTFFAGSDRSRGYGEIQFTLNADSASPSFDLLQWDQSFRNHPKFTSHKLDDGTYFSLKLDAAAILADLFLRPTCEITFDFGQIEFILKVARAQTIRGWQATYKLPKPDDLAVAAGSVYLFCYKGTDIDGLQKYLQQQVLSGIGLRREEGFGRITICDPFHILEEFI